MSSSILKRVALAGVATASLAAVVAGAANAAATDSDRSGKSAPTASSPSHGPTVETQSGIVLECTADGVHVTVYENATYGNSATVILGDPDAGHFGYVEQATPFLVDGQLSVEVDIEGTSASVTGSVAPNGQPTRIVEPQQDAGEQIVTRGTNTPLATELVADIAGDVVPLECAPAFAYDLQVRKVALYGN